MTYLKSLVRKKPKLPPAWVIGYTTRDHLCIDLDNTSYPKVKGLVKMLMSEYPEIGDALIMESSTPTFHQQINYTPPKGVRMQTRRHNFHAIFDNQIPYSKSCDIIETLAHLDVLDEAYTRIRFLRNDMTIRVNKIVLTDQIKPPPKIKTFFIKHTKKKKGNYIWVFLNFYLDAKHL